MVRARSASEILALELASSPDLVNTFREVLKGGLTVRARVLNYSPRMLVEMYRIGKISVDPDLKREYVWSLIKASRFIESLILGFPIPPIFIVALRDSHIVLDGYHRIETLRRFYDNELVLVGTVLKELENCKYGTLNEDLRNRLDWANIPVIEIEISPPDHSQASLIIYEMFRRLNLGAKPLTTLQVLFCGLPVPAIRAVKEILQDEDSRRLLDPRPVEVRQMIDKYLIFMLMVCIYHNRLMNLTSGGKIQHARAITRFLKAGQEEVEKVKQHVKHLIKLALRLGLSRRHFQLTTYGISRRYNLLSSTLFLTIMYLLHELKIELGEEKLIQKRDIILSSIENFYKDPNRRLRIDDREMDIRLVLAYISRQGSDRPLKVLYTELKTYILKMLGES